MSLNWVLNSAKKSYLDESLTRPDWTKDVSRSERLLWLDKNENTDPILVNYLNGLMGQLNKLTLSTYPETAKVYKKLALMNQMKPENFLLTNGSDGSIRVVFDVFVGPGDKVLHTVPTFAMYSVYSKMYGANVITFDYEAGPCGPVFNVAAFFDLIKKEKPKLICLPNPDSPTGTVVSPENLKQLVQLAADVGAVLLIDEAYYLFYNETVLHDVNNNPHLLVCRTFSKAWGAAGVRVGYLAGQPDIMKFIHKNRAMYELSTFSTEFIHILLDHESEVLASVARLQEGKDYFLTELKKMNFVTTVSHGNFIHVNFGLAKEKIHKALKEVVLYRADFPGVKGLDGFSRFSLATKDQFLIIINEIKKVL